jgi:hypothetical protein
VRAIQHYKNSHLHQSKKKLSNFCFKWSGWVLLRTTDLRFHCFWRWLPHNTAVMCSAVSEESICNGSIRSISHTISHGTTLASIHFRLVQDISCCARARVIFLVRLQCMTILWDRIQACVHPSSHRSTRQECRYPYLRATNKLPKQLRVKP